MDTTLLIDESGNITFVYSDSLRPLLALGEPTIKRASHVEPTIEGCWVADLSPVNGPMLGPFERREQALQEEVQWLNRNHLT